MLGTVILRDAAANQWLRFDQPREILAVHDLASVTPALVRAEAWANGGHGYAAGFISYEGAPAFDSALTTHPPGDLPLLWFGLYAPPTPITLPPSDWDAAPPLAWTPNISRETYTAAIARIHDHIARGETYQVNYTMQLRAPFAADPWHFFLRLVHSQPDSYAAFIDTGRFTLCSISPELFIDRAGTHLTMRPMKGTATRGRFPLEDQARADWLAHSEKNRAENVMIVDMVRNDLGRIATTGSVAVSNLWHAERYPTVWQLTSTVEAESDASFVDVLRATFPCASITGAPKRRTMQLISELEPEPRGAYTGCVGFLAPQRRAQFSVTIRTAVIDRAMNRASYGVGGGIVWDSKADSEYAEALQKAQVLNQPPRVFSLLESLRWMPGEGYWLLDYHLRRLRASADYFDMPYDESRILAALEQGASTLRDGTHKARLLLAPDGTLTFSAAPTESQPDPVRLVLAAAPVDSHDIFLFHKTTQRAVYDAAMAPRGDADDVLLWNERGELTDTCAANLVVQIGDEYFTPPIESGLLGGTFRAQLLDEGHISERVLLKTDLPTFDALFRINSVRGWQPAILI